MKDAIDVLEEELRKFEPDSRSLFDIEGDSWDYDPELAEVARGAVEARHDPVKTILEILPERIGDGYVFRRSKEIVRIIEGHECALCGISELKAYKKYTSRLQIHNINKRKYFDPTLAGDFPWNLVAICSSCHSKAHFGSPERGREFFEEEVSKLPDRPNWWIRYYNGPEQ